MNNKVYIATLSSLLLLLTAPLYADAGISRVNGNFSDLGSYFKSPRLKAARLASEQTSHTDLENAFKVSGKIRELGRFNAYFEKQYNLKFTGAGSENVYLQGEAFFKNGESTIVTARLEKKSAGKYKVHLEFLDEGLGRYTLKRAFRIVKATFLTNSAGQVSHKRVNRGKKRAVRDAGCGTRHPLAAYLDQEHTPVKQSGTLKQISIRIEGDNELQGKGKTLSTYLATMMNLVDSWYRRDLGVTYSSTIVSEAQSYSSTVEYNESDYTYPLHQEMRQKQPASSRTDYIHYLVTGKNAIGNSDGLAGVVPDLGTICKSKPNSIGFTIYYADDENFNYETTAHEVGHLFGAEHDDASTGSTGYLMNSGTNNVNNYVSEFSTKSKNQVSNHISSNGSCFSSVENDGGSGGGDGDGDGGESDNDDYDDDRGDEDSYTLTLKHNTRKGKLISVARKNGARLQRRERRKEVRVRWLCGCDGEYDEVMATKTLNRKSKKAFRYDAEETGEACIAQLITKSGGQVLVASSAVENVGEGCEYDDDYYDDDYYDDYDDYDDYYDE